VVASCVTAEWLRHSGGEADKLRAHLAKINDETDRLDEYCDQVGITPHFPRPEYRRLSLAEGLNDLSRQVLHRALPVEADRDCIIRAHTRASTYIAPSL